MIEPSGMDGIWRIAMVTLRMQLLSGLWHKANAGTKQGKARGEMREKYLVCALGGNKQQN